MKKYIRMKFAVMLVLSLFSIAALAQTEKGAVMVGGSLGFKTGEGASEFMFDPNVGFFIANNFAVGGSISYSSARLGDVKTNNFGIGPFARYYFGTTNTKPFVVSEFDFLASKIKSGNTELNTNGVGFLFGMGFAAFVNETVAIEGITGYNYSKFKNADGVSGFAMRFGFQIYFNNRSMNALKTNVLGN